MYGYEEHIDITPEQLLQKVTQQEIFEFILKEPFVFGNRYISPLREDTSPDCRFEERADGTIIFVDFGEKYLTGHTHRSCFGMVMDAFKVSISGAVRILCSQFGLSTSSNDYQPVAKAQYHKIEGDRVITDISYTAKTASKSDIWYWSQYLIRIGQLAQDNVHCISRYTVKNNKGFFTIHTYKFAYAYDFIDRVKIYQPYKEKYKWTTNCDEDNIGNFDNLPPTGDELIIQKSYKDHRVLRNMDMSLYVVWFQNEGCVPSMDILKNLTERFTLITIFYDNDEDGIKAAEKLVAIFNMIKEGCARMIYLPRKRKHKQLHGAYLKDPAAFINKEGKNNLRTVLKQIGL